eukprot:869765_1
MFVILADSMQKIVFFSSHRQSECDYSPITMEYGSKVNIIGCTFTGFTDHKLQRTCILLHDQFGEVERHGFPDETWLKCVGNIFKDNCGYPIAMDNVPVEFAQTLKSVIT